MNLPQSATEFLDTFIGFCRRSPGNDRPLPVIHVYAFSSAEDPVVDVAERCARVMNCRVGDLGSRVVSTNTLGITGVSGSKELEIVSRALYVDRSAVGHLVRDVAPKKLMVCFSFHLPQVVADSDPLYGSIESAAKKRRASSPSPSAS